MRLPSPERHPLAVSVLATAGFLVGIIGVSAIGARGGTPLAIESSGAIGRAALAFAAALALRRMGGTLVLDPRTGGRAAWLGALPVLVYVLAVYPALLNGDYRLSLDVPLLSACVAANGLAAGIVEELVFRGIVLFALVGNAAGPRRIARGILLSSLLFSLPHALNVFTGEDRVRVLSQLIWSFLLGVVFASLVAAYGNVWPVAIAHGLGNAFVHLNRYGRPVHLEALQAVLLAAAPLPLVAYALFQLRRKTTRERALVR